MYFKAGCRVLLWPLHHKLFLQFSVTRIEMILYFCLIHYRNFGAHIHMAHLQFGVALKLPPFIKRILKSWASNPAPLSLCSAAAVKVTPRSWRTDSSLLHLRFPQQRDKLQMLQIELLPPRSRSHLAQECIEFGVCSGGKGAAFR